MNSYVIEKSHLK